MLIAYGLDKISSTGLGFSHLNEIKQSVVDERLRTLNAAVKKLLAKKDAKIEIFVMKGND